MDGETSLRYTITTKKTMHIDLLYVSHYYVLDLVMDFFPLEKTSCDLLLKGCLMTTRIYIKNFK